MHVKLTALVALLAVATAGSLAAQSGERPREATRGSRVTRTRPRVPATGAVAGIASPPVVLAPSNPLFYAPAGSFLANVPVIVFPDGRVFADFGRGFEQVVRGCAGGAPTFVATVQPAPVQPVVLQPVVTQPPVVVTQPQPYNPPVAGQQVVTQPLTPTSAGQILAGQSVVVNSNACFAVSERGQVFVFSR